MDNFFPTFDSEWMAKLTGHTGPRGSVSTSTTISKSAINSTTNSSLCNQGSKRLWNNDEGPPADGDDDSLEQPRLNQPRHQDPDASLKLACPFRKYDPRKYNFGDSRYRTCATTPWESITPLK